MQATSPSLSPPRSSGDLQRLILYIAGVVIVGAALSPWLCQAVQALLSWMLEHGHLSASPQEQGPIMREITRAGFERFFNRSVQICALLGLPLLVKASRGGERLLPSLQLTRRGVVELLVGFVFAGGVLLALGAAYCQWKLYTVRPDAPLWSFGTPLTAAIGASVGEELIFRGLILGMMLRSMSTGRALFWSTFLFAIVHFIKPPDSLHLDPKQVEWSTGFWLLGRIGSHFSQWNVLLAEFGTLFAVGWVLSSARVQTGALWAGLGLHAGWVFGLKYFSQLTKSTKPLRAGDYLPWIGDNLKVGIAPLIVVLLTGGFVLMMLSILRGERADDERSDEG